MAPEANQDQPIRWKERIGTIAIGHTFKQVEEIVFDWNLYPAVIALLGTLVGGLVMTAFSAIMCYLYLLFYDWAKKDWFGFELLKEVRDGQENESRVWRVVQRIARKGNWPAFVALSLYTDPFMTTVYMRRSTEAFRGLSARDWKIFWGSVLVANFFWTFVTTGLVMIARLFLKWFTLN